MNNFFKELKNHKKIVFLLVFLVIAGFVGLGFLGNKNTAPQYQTAAATKGTLVESVTASGQITTANSVQITIQASGVIKNVMVKNGDQVVQGQTVAELTPDQASQQKQAQAWSSYLSAKNALESAESKLNSLQASEFKANQTFINGSVARSLTANDPTYIQENALWLQAEADYKNQQSIITQAQAALNSAALTLSQTSSTITAPVSGKVTGLTITQGAIITLSSSSSGSTSTSQVLGSVNQQGLVQAQVNLSEIDAVKVTEGQKVTLTMDAFPNQTFTGKVMSINTNGIVSSGVATYPAVIAYDFGTDRMYPNMGVSASIIIKVKDNILLVPSGAVQNQNGQTSVRVLKNGHVQTVQVEAGDSSDTETEIISGISEGDQVITNVISTIPAPGQSSSPFGVGRGAGTFRTFGGGGR